ncbi:MAG: hypothetical protein KAY24_02095 [Candidatus Eisenbacteria sp.]|nr:hypothetical protein [Candidatus Eisenbacteria bacterium]
MGQVKVIRVLVSVSIMLYCALTVPRAEIELGGYYENTLQIGYSQDSDETIVDASKLQLDIHAGESDGEWAFRGDVNFIEYHTGATYNVDLLLPDDVAEQMRTKGIPAVVAFERRGVYLDNAFFTWNHGDVRLRAGKQQLNWGSGYSINPTDLFHRKMMIDPGYEKEGVAALRLDYRWGLGGQLALITAPSEDFASTGYALRVGTHIKAIGYDLVLTVHQVIDSTSVDPDSLRPRHQDRTALGLDFSGGFLGMGIWSEGNYNFMEAEDDFLRVVAGVDYTFCSGHYVMLEGLLNTRAERRNPYPLHDWMAYLLYAEPVGPGWVTFGLRQDLSALTSASLYVFGSPDASFTINPRIDVSVAQNADLTIYGVATAGKEDGAFHPGFYCILIRATVYF